MINATEAKEHTALVIEKIIQTSIDKLYKRIEQEIEWSINRGDYFCVISISDDFLQTNNKKSLKQIYTEIERRYQENGYSIEIKKSCAVAFSKIGDVRIVISWGN